jgi:hypothetical protein
MSAECVSTPRIALHYIPPSHKDSNHLPVNVDSCTAPSGGSQELPQLISLTKWQLYNYSYFIEEEIEAQKY